MALGMQRTKVFVSYSHRDGVWLEELRPHLGSLAREKGFASLFWDDTKIRGGSEWKAEIFDALHSAKVAILLVSKHFLDSDFITTNELPALLAAAQTDEAVILPIILSPCRFAHHPKLSKFQSVNPPSAPLEGMTKVQYESVFLRVTELVDEALTTREGESAESEPHATGVPALGPKGKPQPTPARQIVRPRSLPRTSSAKPAPKPSESGTLTGQDENWTRIVVQSLEDGSIQYQTLQDEIRFDCVLAPPQRRLVEDLANRILRSPFFSSELASTLFELLIPNALKPHLFHSDGTILILDSTTARYPWELLQDGANTNALPISVRHPLIRQTVSDHFTPRPSARRHEALVIGEPEVGSPFVPLPGARYEAEQIADLLRHSGFVVNCQIGASAVQVISALFSRPYQLLHLSGHGVHEYQLGDTRAVTGLVIGDGMFFTGAEVVQLRVAPEVVFLNASYLGRHSTPQPRSESESSVRFAASLPDQFISIGSQAVIAPAGTVDDAAAVTFATRFYQAMFSGTSLGQAVLAARREAHERHNTNTWGMYLCYGDPGYRLMHQQSDHDD